jgi:hypothetical protein
MTTVLRHLRFHAISYLALFVALGGTAYAAATIGSAEVIDDSLRSIDLKNNDVRSADVRNDTASNGGLVGVDVADGSISGADLATDAVTAEDIDESTLDEVRIAGNQDSACNPSSGTFVTCAGAEIGGLPGDKEDFIFLATLNWHTNAGGGSGACELRLEGASAPLEDRPIGENGNTTDAAHPNSTTLVAVGNVSTLSDAEAVLVRCAEDEADIAFTDVDLAALSLD